MLTLLLKEACQTPPLQYQTVRSFRLQKAFKSPQAIQQSISMLTHSLIGQSLSTHLIFQLMKFHKNQGNTLSGITKIQEIIWAFQMIKSIFLVL